MIEFRALYFDGKTSRPQTVTVYFDGVALTLRDDSGYSDRSLPLASCDIVPPLGRSRRSIRFPDGGLVETDDARAVDALEKVTGRNRGMKAVHSLESRWKAVACAVIGLLLCFGAFTLYGIPFIAKRVAYSIPLTSMEKVSEDALKAMDKRFFGPSGLSAARTRRTELVFREVGKGMGKGYDYRLVLRKGKAVGANAFALPSGIIVVSDELIERAGSDRELAGVLAHEMAHVDGRHMMRQLLQSAGVFFMISVVTGDIASISSLAASLPTLLVQTGYSRGFEREADREAALYCIRKGWGTAPYRNMLMNLHKGDPEPSSRAFFSTHPSLQERLNYIDRLEKFGETGGTRD
jgi:Zn-dependent protease with chaperone function